MTYFRAIAILCIVAGHSLWGYGKLSQSNAILFVNATVYFVFIAGYLFQYLSYKFDYKEYLKKKFTNVIIPYFITTVPFAIIFTFTLTDKNCPLYYMSEPMRFISSFPCGLYVNPVTWFVGMICIFFLFAPVFLKLEKNKKVWYTLLFVSLIFSIFVNRPSTYDISKHIDSATSPVKIWFCVAYYIYFRSFVHFLAAYIGGMTLCTFIQKYPKYIHKYKKQIFTILLSVFIISYFICLFCYFRIDRLFFIKMILGLIIFCFLYLYEKKIQSIKQLDKCLRVLAKYSFGIFFIHNYFIRYMTYNTITYTVKPEVLNVWENTFKAFLYSSCKTYVAIFGSLIVLWTIKTILNKLGVKNTRMFIGV